MYVALMSGLLVLFGDTKDVPSVWAVAILALITGLFADQARHKLTSLGNSLLGTTPEAAPPRGDGGPAPLEESDDDPAAADVGSKGPQGAGLDARILEAPPLGDGESGVTILGPARGVPEPPPPI